MPTDWNSHIPAQLPDSVGTPIALQQKLMRHSDIRTTMNVYGDVMPEVMRNAHDRLAQKVLKPA